LAAVAVAAPLLAQEVIHRRVEIASPGIGMASPTDAVFVHGPGVRLEGPPKKGAPYSAEAVTQTVQRLNDGNRIVRENRAKLYRDNEGRTRREETLHAVGPWAVAGEQPVRIFINDPVAGEHWVLEPENKIARKMNMPRIEDHVRVTKNVNVDVDVTLDVPEGAGPLHTSVERSHVWVAEGDVDEAPNVEDLGTRMIEGVEAKGSRITRTIPAGQIGNERPIEVLFERWHSGELGVDVMTRRKDPRSAEITYTLTSIQRTEPLPGMFQPPPDYEVKDAEDNVFIRRIEKE